MKIKFICDVPPYHSKEWNYCAWSNTSSIAGPPEGWKRVCFEVYLPVKEYDEKLTDGQLLDKAE